MIVEILLGVIVVELLMVLWWGRPEKDDVVPRSGNAAVPRPAEPAEIRDDGPTLHDLRIEALIQMVDPTWKLGDSREHIHLVPDGLGHIVKAELS